ncbi:MAG: hypothetical protein ACQEXQ_23540 [Bacillota bacterium]
MLRSFFGDIVDVNNTDGRWNTVNEKMGAMDRESLLSLLERERTIIISPVMKAARRRCRHRKR